MLMLPKGAVARPQCPAGLFLMTAVLVPPVNCLYAALIPKGRRTKMNKVARHRSAVCESQTVFVMMAS